jgi:alkylated DNA repair dioxygenase AlkB
MTNMQSTISKVFDSTGYVKVPEFLSPYMARLFVEYFTNKIRKGEWQEREKDDYGKTPTSKFQCYADPLVEIMLKQQLETIEKIVGKGLYPTYSFARVYQEGEELKPHTDRPSCEISVTVSVMSPPWPIWMQYKDNDPSKFILSAGDAVVYKGCEAMHWRRQLPTPDLCMQFMLHYVIKDGDNKDYKFDKRTNLGMPPNK